MRKLSFEENLRHRLRDLKHLGHRPSSSSTAEGLVYLSIGAVVGLAAGVIIAQKYGGFGGVTSRVTDRVRDRLSRTHLEGYDAHDYEDEALDEGAYEDESLTPLEALEERVLETYRNDPVLSERAIDIGALDAGIIELTGWVHSPEESKHAVTIARGTPGVETVVNRLAVRDDTDWYDDQATRYATGDASLTEGQWEGPAAPREAPAPRAD